MHSSRHAALTYFPCDSASLFLVTECGRKFTEEVEDDELVVALRGAERCLRVLESVCCYFSVFVFVFRDMRIFVFIDSGYLSLLRG